MKCEGAHVELIARDEARLKLRDYLIKRRVQGFQPCAGRKGGGDRGFENPELLPSSNGEEV